LSRVGPLHSSQPNLSVQPEFHQSQPRVDITAQQPQNRSGEVEVTLTNGQQQPQNRTQNDATVVGEHRQHSVRFAEGGAPSNDPLPGCSHWDVPRGAPTVVPNGPADPDMAMDVDVVGEGADNFQVS